MGESERACKKCQQTKPISCFERFKRRRDGGYSQRRVCRECYNQRRRELQGGAVRDEVRRKERLEVELQKVPECQLVREYRKANPQGTSDWCESRLVLGYKGFEWDIRKSSFLGGNRPWRNFRHAKFKAGFFIYKFVSEDGEVLYIGKSKKLNARMSAHFAPSEIQKPQCGWKTDVDKVMVMQLETEADMHFAELYLINKVKPRYNKSGIAADQLSFEIDLPEFEQMWVGMINDETDPKYIKA